MTASDSLRHASPRGRPHLGPRVVVTAALWVELEQAVDLVRGSLERSPYLADLLAWHVERPDLIRHRQLVISFESPYADATEPAGSHGTRHCTVRVHPAVAGELVERASELGLPRAVYNANAIAEFLGSPRLHTPTMSEEGLPLAM